MLEGIENTFLWAQIIGLCAMVISILVWQIKNPRYVVICYVPAALLWATQYMMLGAPIGAIINFGSAIKDSSVYAASEKQFSYLTVTFLAAVWTLGLYSYSTAYDLLPLLGVTIFNLSLFQRDNRPLIARAIIMGQCFWIGYNIIVGAWMGVACGLLIIISSIIGMIRHEKWEIGQCNRSFFPSLARELFVFPRLQTYP